MAPAPASTRTRDYKDEAPNPWETFATLPRPGRVTCASSGLLSVRLLLLHPGCFGHELGQVANPHRFFQRTRFHRVLDHSHAERASHCDALRFGLTQLIETLLIDAGPFVFFLPEAPAARTAAEGAILRLIDLRDFGARNRAQCLARAIPLAIVSRHVARIVIGYARAQHFPGFQAPRAHQLGEKFRLVHDVIVTAEIRIFVLEIVKAMRALRHDAPRLVTV